MTAATRLRGLGAFYVKDSSGQTVDCDLWSNIFNGACWGVVGGSTGTPVQTDPSTGGPTSQPDCSQLENTLNGNCNVVQWATGNPLLSTSVLGGGLLIAGVGVLAVLLLLRR